jgi:hypothetical protein
MNPSKIVVCPHCHRPNRLPDARLGEQGRCGHCQSPLFDGTPTALTEASFDRHIERSELPIPTLVVFRKGREVARQAGAMDSASIVRWLRSVS